MTVFASHKAGSYDISQLNLFFKFYFLISLHNLSVKYKCPLLSFIDCSFLEKKQRQKEIAGIDKMEHLKNAGVKYYKSFNT